MITYSSFTRRTVKWWKVSFGNFKHIHSAQGVVSNLAGDTQETKSLSSCSRHGAPDLCRSLTIVTNSPWLPCLETVANAFRLTQRHFLQKLIPKDGAKKRRVSKRCVVCNPAKKEILVSEGVAAGTRNFVRMQAVPQSPLCVEPCFVLYNSKASCLYQTEYSL